jgi:acyl-CoA synthetase (AMP-forming)/AMP-acid ligase II
MQHFGSQLSHLTIGDYIDQYAAQFPDRLALVSERRWITYGELANEVDQAARGMKRLGMEVGDRVAVLSPPRVEVFVTFLAAAKLGLTWLGLNPKYQLPELEYVVSDAQPSLLFGVDYAEGRSYEKELQALRRPSIKKFVGFDKGIHYDIDFERWMSTDTEDEESAYQRHVQSVRCQSPAMLVYTSGSSGKPKGVLLSHRALLQRSRNQLGQFPASPFPTIVNPFPINHIGGMHLVSFYAFVGGGTLFYIERFDPDLIIDLLEKKAINSLIIVPTMLHLLSVNPRFRPDLLDSLQWLFFSGAAMPKDLMEMLFRSQAGIGLTYGMTETSGGVTYCKADRARSNLDEMTTSIGRPVPEGEVRVIKEDGSVCEPGESGEIQVRAEFCMSGYFRRDEATKAAFTSDNWMKTGDLATLRPDGNLSFSGRMSEMFKSGGYNVYPREIEMALEAHPDVALVAVVAKKDPIYDEVGFAYVIPQVGKEVDAAELSQWARTRLANYKVPKRFIIRQELPLLPVGKVDKVRLRQMANADPEDE